MQVVHSLQYAADCCSHCICFHCQAHRAVALNEPQARLLHADMGAQT